MFGFKSKKDKRIEELERLLVDMHFKTPVITESEKNVRTYATGIVLEENMPVEYAKEKIAIKMSEVLKDLINYDVEDDGLRKVLKGYLKVVT